MTSIPGLPSLSATSALRVDTDLSILKSYELVRYLDRSQQARLPDRVAREGTGPEPAVLRPDLFRAAEAAAPAAIRTPVPVAVASPAQVQIHPPDDPAEATPPRPVEAAYAMRIQSLPVADAAAPKPAPVVPQARPEIDRIGELIDQIIESRELSPLPLHRREAGDLVDADKPSLRVETDIVAPVARSMRQRDS